MSILITIDFGDPRRQLWRMDGIRRGDDVVLRFDLPGIDTDSIEVTVDRGVLSVNARREEEYGQDDRLFKAIKK